MEEFIFRLIVGILGAISAVIITKLWKDWEHKRGELTGTWEQIVYDDIGNIKKTDLIILKHNHFSKKVLGIISRKTPNKESKKEWVFEGIIRGNVLFMIYWSNNLSTNPGSYGTIQLYIINENNLSGFYIKPNSNEKDGEILNLLIQNKIDWKRKENTLS